MREPAELMPMSFPRPGRALKAILATVTAISIAGAILCNWVPGGSRGLAIFAWFMCSPEHVFTHPWTLLTSGLLTAPNQLSHLIYTLIGLFFLTPELERRWGGWGLVRFFILAVVLGNVTALAVDRVPVQAAIFHPGAMFGGEAAIAAAAIAWSRHNADKQVRLFFVLPVSGRHLFWVTIGFCVFGLVYHQSVPEGAFAPFGGVLAGILLSGSPSPARAAWLRIKLAYLRSRGATVSIDLEGGASRRPTSASGLAKKRSAAAPSLRVLSGGLEDELKSRKPPKDKRHLN